uniref:Putative adenylate cyclase regulatory protein n=1 Tax=Rhizophora mucronata TaxID=61149 RepID=A0A2P2MLM1_RHIMU
MKIIYLEFFLEDIAKVEAQSGWQLHSLDLSAIYSGELENVTPSWNYVLKKYVRTLINIRHSLCFQGT